jgi:putative endonuclease
VFCTDDRADVTFITDKLRPVHYPLSFRPTGGTCFSPPDPISLRYHVYIMASCSRILYVGVTGCLMVRVLRHRAGQVAPSRANTASTDWCTQAFQNIGDAIARETQIKGWTRDKKPSLIRLHNPTWEDLAEGWGEPAPMQFKGKAGSSRWSE